MNEVEIGWVSQKLTKYRSAFTGKVKTLTSILPQ